MNEIPLQQVGQRTLELRRTIRTIQDALDGSAFSRQYGPALNAIDGQLDSAKFRLVFVGDWNSGKSSLINHMLFGVDEAGAVLPVSDKPTTTCIMTIMYSDEPVLSRIAFGPSGKQELARGEEAVRQALQKNDCSMLPTAADEESYYELLLGWNNDVLKAGLLIIDSPGLEDPDHFHSLVTAQYIRQANGVVVVTEADRPVTEHILKFLRNKEFCVQTSKFFFLMNKIDRIRSGDESPEERLDYLRQMVNSELVITPVYVRNQLNPEAQRLCSGVSKARFYAVSAVTGDGIESVVSELKKFAETECQNALWESCDRALHAVIDAVCDSIGRERQAAQGRAEEWETRARLLEQERVVVDEKVAVQIKIFEEKWDSAVNDGIHGVEEIFRRAVAQASDEFKKHSATVKSKIWPAGLAQQFDKFCANQQRNLECELDDLDHKMRLHIERASIRLMETLGGLVSGYRAIAGLGRIHADINVGSVDFSAGEKWLATIATGFGVISGGVALATGAAIATTLPAWVPATISSALASAGILTGTSVSIIVASVAFPAAVVMLGGNVYMLHRQRKNTVENCYKYVRGLESLGDTIRTRYRGCARDAYPSIRDAIVIGMQTVIEDINTEINTCRQAARDQRLSEGTSRVCRALEDQRILKRIPVTESNSTLSFDAAQIQNVDKLDKRPPAEIKGKPATSRPLLLEPGDDWESALYLGKSYDLRDRQTAKEFLRLLWSKGATCRSRAILVRNKFPKPSSLFMPGMKAGIVSEHGLVIKTFYKKVVGKVRDRTRNKGSDSYYLRAYADSDST